MIHAKFGFNVSVQKLETVFMLLARMTFGGCRNPAIFQRFSEAVRWIFENLGVENVHNYLDDYVGWPESGLLIDANRQYNIARKVCGNIRMPLSPKPGGCVPPTTNVTAFGFEFSLKQTQNE